MRLPNTFWIVTLVLLAFAAFYLKSVMFIDPDFGWHVRMGDYILQHGVPLTDVFTYTMPSFMPVDNEWAANIGIFLLETKSELFMFILFSLIPLAATIVLLPKKPNFMHLGIFILSASSLIAFAGVRLQVVSWFLFAVLLKIIFDEKLWRRVRFFLPFITCLWANLHGGFAIAFLLLFIFLLERIVTKKIDKLDVLVFGSSFIATLVNPYGPRLWSEILFVAADARLRFAISEWLPLVFLLDFSILMLLALSLVLIYKYHKKLSLFEILLFFIFLALAASSVRHAPFFILVNLFLSAKLVTLVYLDLGKIEKRRFKTVSFIFLLISLLFFGYNCFSIFVRQGLPSKNAYPSNKAVNFVRQNSSEGEIFSDFAWNGYLLWKVPWKKDFIDGRMPSWYFHAPKGESDSAFNDYENIISGRKDYKPFFKKYNIKYVLLPKKFLIEDSGLATYIAKLLSPVNKKAFSLQVVLAKDGWKKEYEDAGAVFFRAPQGPF